MNAPPGVLRRDDAGPEGDGIAAGVGLADVALARATGAPRIEGNAVRLLRDAAGNFPTWLAAIRAAQRSVQVEAYIFADDEVGREFAAALAERARAGVRVRVLYDWLGTWGSGALWGTLRASGAEVRRFNPFRFDAPLEWVSRDHRKQIIVDGAKAFVSGLCISSRWLGRPERRLEPWRDTGMELIGPAVAELQRAFNATWHVAGGLVDPERDAVLTPAVAGGTAVRVIAGVPSTAGVFRVDQVVASAARRYLWLTDAYFVGISPYVQALCAAARDGVDVRLLVPGASDLPALRPLSRAGYRPLLAAGVRIFEWNGTMLHAKTAVADGLWARVGSTNLNFASFLHNWELDVAIEDPEVAEELADMYEEDLGRATEIVLTRHYRLGFAAKPPRRWRRTEQARRDPAGSAKRVAAGALSVGSAVGAALTNRRLLGPAEAGLLVKVAVVLLVLAVVALVWPLVLAVPVAVIAGWLGLATAWKARVLRRTTAPPASEVTPAEGAGAAVHAPDDGVRPASGGRADPSGGS